MGRWARGEAPPIPNDIAKLSHTLNSEAWQKRLQYSLIVDGPEVGTKIRRQMGFNVWSKNDALNFPVVFFTPQHLPEAIRSSSYGFVDATYQSVPAIYGAFQFLTFGVESFGKVCIGRRSPTLL